MAEQARTPDPTRPPSPAPKGAAVEEDPKARAARRAAELRDHGSLDDGVDEFYIDPASIPDGWTYEWKRKTVLGQEDPAYQVAVARAGWEPVPASRHPEMMPTGWSGAIIERKGQVLMERPTEIVNQAKARDYKRARDQVRMKESQLSGTPANTLERTPANISKSYEAVIPVPK